MIRFLILVAALWCSIFAMFVLAAGLVLIVHDPAMEVALRKTWAVAALIFAVVLAPALHRPVR